MHPEEYDNVSQSADQVDQTRVVHTRSTQDEDTHDGPQCCIMGQACMATVRRAAVMRARLPLHTLEQVPTTPTMLLATLVCSHMAGHHRLGAQA